MLSTICLPGRLLSGGIWAGAGPAALEDTKSVLANWEANTAKPASEDQTQEMVAGHWIIHHHQSVHFSFLFLNHFAY